MKTFYTLLLAFGLCLTSHAQNLQVLSNTNNVQLSQIEWDEFNQLAFSDTHTLILNDATSYVFNNGTSVKAVVIKNVNGASLLNSFTPSLNDVKLLQLNWNVNDVYNLSNQLNQKLPKLEYIYVTSYEMLNQSNVENIIGSLKNQFPNAKIIYQTLKDS